MSLIFMFYLRQHFSIKLSKKIRRNPIGNRAILVFSGQKLGTRLILILSFHSPFYIFSKRKLPEITPKFPMLKIEKMNFKVQRNCANTGKISSSVSLHQYFQVFHTKFKICFSTFGVVKNDFLLRSYLKQSYRRFQSVRCK